MARGYLGKISAVVSANTGDYVRKLNDSAARTREFAQGIQGDLRRASAQVSQTFSRILTPIQQFERAIQNASSARLKFNGFDGAIRTVQELRRRIGELENQADIDFVVSASGLKNLTELKKTLAGLKDSDIDLAVRVGADGIRALLADVQEVDGKVVNVKTKIEASRLEMILGKIDKLDGNQIRRLQIAVEDRQLSQAEQQARRLFGLAREIGQPLAQAAVDFDKLPLAVQASFPVLGRVQEEFERIDAAIRSNGAVGEQEYGRLRDSAESAGLAIQRLSELQSRVSGLRSGGELAFSNPELDAALARASAAGDRAAEAPLSVRVASSGNISSLLADIKSLGDEAVVLDGRLRTATDPATVAALRTQFQRLTGDINAAVDLLDGEIGVKVDTSAAQKAIDDLVKRKKEINDALQFTLTGDVQNIRQAAGEYNRLRGEVEKFDAARRQAFSGSLQAVADIIGNDDETQLASVVALLRQISDEVENQKKLDLGAKKQADDVERLKNAMQAISDSIGEPAAPIDRLRKNVDEATAAVKKLTGAQRQRADAALAALKAGIDANQGNATFLPLLARRAGAIRDAAISAAPAPTPRGPSAPPPPRNPLGDPFSAATSGAGIGLNSSRLLSSLASSINSVKSSLDELPVSVQVRFIPAIKAAEDEFARLAAAPNATATAIENATRKVSALKSEAERAAAAAKLVSFDRLSEAAGVGRATAEVKALGDIMINIGARPGSALAAAFDRVNKIVADGIARNITGTKSWQRQYEGVRDAAVRAAAATGKISEARAKQAIARAGDVGRAGLDRFQLAAQQAGFALDDFFSVTGGVEQRLRAVSNNISQLGFIIGGTAGLFTALGVTIGTQIVLAISKFAFKSDEGKAAAKALSDTLKNQKDRVRELSDAYKELANSIADSGLSEAGRRLSERSRSRQQRERQAGDIALNEFAIRSPSFALSLGRERLAQERVQNAESLSGATAAVRAERQASAARAREERIARSRIRSLADSTSISEIRRQRSETRDELARERARRSRASAAAVFTAGISTFIPGFETNRNRENRLRERLATQEGAITLARQRQTESFVQRGQRIGDRLAPFQENVRGFTETQGRIDRILTRFAETAQKAADGSLSPGEIEAATNQLERLAAEAERVAISLQGLQGVLDRQVSQLADAFVSDLQGREEQLRRQANAAEARNDPAAAGLRRDEQDIIQARRRAEQQRQNIEEQISSERQRFEQELIAGRGNAEDRRRAEEIRAQREIIDSEKASQAEKERARLRLSQLELEQSQSFEQRAGVQRLRDQANQGDIAAQREIQRIESRQRGRDLALTELEQRRRELRQQAADIGEAFRSGDIGPGGVQAFARNMGGQLAPMLAQFRDEVLSARLQGPSRAALRVADINTAEGRSELNRLIRGEDSNRDVNLLELQNQSRLLQEIKVAIESETNMVVDL